MSRPVEAQNSVHTQPGLGGVVHSHRFSVFHEPMLLRPRTPIGDLEFFVLEFHRQADEEVLQVPPPPPNPPELESARGAGVSP